MHTAKKAPAKPKAATIGPYTVAGQTIYLEPPQRFAHRAAITQACSDAYRDSAATQLVLAACIGLCCPALSNKAGAPDYQNKILDYGADMLDWLLGEGEKIGEVYLDTAGAITIAGNSALNLVLRGTLRTEVLEEALGNSEPPPASGSENSSA